MSASASAPATVTSETGEDLPRVLVVTSIKLLVLLAICRQGSVGSLLLWCQSSGRNCSCTWGILTTTMYLSAGVTLLDNTFRNNYVFLYMVLFAFRGEERGGYQDHESGKSQDEAPFRNFVPSFCGLVFLPSGLHEEALTNLRQVQFDTESKFYADCFWFQLIIDGYLHKQSFGIWELSPGRTPIKLQTWQIMIMKRTTHI